MENQHNKSNTFHFEGIRWIPGYDDFDYDDFTILAENEEEAWKALLKITRNTWKSVGITEINGVRVNTEKC